MREPIRLSGMAANVLLIAGCSTPNTLRFERFELYQVDSWEATPYYEECAAMLDGRPANTLAEAIAPQRLDDRSIGRSIVSRPQMRWGEIETREDRGPFYVAVMEVAKDNRFSSDELLSFLAHPDVRTRGAAHLALLARYRVPMDFDYEYSPDLELVAEQRQFWADIVRRTSPADEHSPRNEMIWNRPQFPGD